MGVVRTLDTNPCVRKNLPIDDMDSKVLISMRELSQILATTGISISSSQEENILTEVKNLSTSPKIIEEIQSHEIQTNSPCQSTKGTRNLESTFDGEQPEIEEFSTYISTNTLFTQEVEHSKEEDLDGMRKEGENQDYIERWFQEIMRPQYLSFFETF